MHLKVPLWKLSVTSNLERGKKRPSKEWLASALREHQRTSPFLASTSRKDLVSYLRLPPTLTPTLNVHSSQSNHSLIVYFFCVFSGSDYILCLESFIFARSKQLLSVHKAWSENSICGRAWDATQWWGMCVHTVCKALGSNPSITTKEDRNRLFSQMPPRPSGLCL